jgi:hypothetical protein
VTDTKEFYVLRYTAHVPVDQRKHADTEGRFDTWLDADDARLLRPNKDLLEVQGPRENP